MQPQVTVNAPALGGVVPTGRRIPFDVTVTTDSPAPCGDVTVNLVLQTLTGTQTVDSATGCRGVLTATLPAGVGANDTRAYSIQAVYAPGAGSSVISLVQGEATRALQPQRKQAEHYDTDASIRTETTGDTDGGGLNVAFIRNGFSMKYSNVNLAGISKMRFRLASSSTGGTLELRNGTATGDLLGTVNDHQHRRRPAVPVVRDGGHRPGRPVHPVPDLQGGPHRLHRQRELLRVRRRRHGAGERGADGVGHA